MRFLAITIAIALVNIEFANAFDMNNCSVTFSPDGGTTQALVKYIGAAKKNIRMLAYNFTSIPVAQALMDAKARGVDVKAVFDKSVPSEKNTALPMIILAKIPYKIDRTHAIAHNKTIIIDGEWIETGSFNYSANAELKNGENALICHSADGYKLYRSNWDLHWSHSDNK